MLTLKQIRDDKEAAIRKLAKKGVDAAPVIEKIETLDDRRKAIQVELDNTLAAQNKAAKEIGALMGQGRREEAEERKRFVADLKEKSNRLQAESREVQEELQAAIVTLPNFPAEIVPEGKTAEDNLVVKLVESYTELPENPLYSASAIRATLPAEAIYSIEHCQRAVLAVLRRMEAADWAAIDDVTDGLENRLARAAQSATSLEELYTTIKTKRYTHARIRRIVLRAYLGIGKGDYPATPPYLRVLGFNAAGKALLAKMQHSATLPTVTRMADVKDLSPEGQALFRLESRCTDLYALGAKKPLPGGAEQRLQIVST